MHVTHPGSVQLLQGHLYGVVIDLFDLCQTVNEGCLYSRLVGQLASHSLVRIDNVVCVQFLTIVELNALTDFESYFHAISGPGPAFSQSGYDVTGSINAGQTFVYVEQNSVSIGSQHDVGVDGVEVSSYSYGQLSFFCLFFFLGAASGEDHGQNHDNTQQLEQSRLFHKTFLLKYSILGSIAITV